MPKVDRLLFEARRYGRRQKFTHALKLYQQVLDVEPEQLEALVGKGGCHYKLGDDDLARITWEEALRVDPSNTKVREFLSRLGVGREGKNGKKSPGGGRIFGAGGNHRIFSLPLPRWPAVVIMIAVFVFLLSLPFLVRGLLRVPSSGSGDIADRPIVADTFNK